MSFPDMKNYFFRIILVTGSLFATNSVSVKDSEKVAQFDLAKQNFLIKTVFLFDSVISCFIF
jgi:hypothetical protein